MMMMTLTLMKQRDYYDRAHSLDLRFCAAVDADADDTRLRLRLASGAGR